MLYGHYSSSKAYPDADYPFPLIVEDVPNYSGCTDTNNCTNANVTRGMALKQRNNVINMNSTLIDALLNLVPLVIKQSCKQVQIENPNFVFCRMFAWFVMKYGRTSVDDREANCTTMTLELHLSQGFKLVVVCLFQGNTFANLPKHPIPNNNIINISICVIHQTGLFAEEYKAWIMRGDNPTNDMDFAAFCTFWETAINIASFTANPALQHGYGINAIENDASAASLTDAISNFGTAYPAMQESLRNNNASINAMQGQIQMLCNAIGNQPPAGML
jgi:hypothetical protein